jgi:hypothetical protein
MSYTEAVATKMLATNCVSCGRPLVDAVSVEVGMGPECRKDLFPESIDGEARKEANLIVHQAAIAAQTGHAEKVMELAIKLVEMGFTELGGKVARRFKNGVVRAEINADIVITVVGGNIQVKTPFRRGDKEAFIQAWRSIPGRRYNRKMCLNEVPTEQRAALWMLLQRFFPGKWGNGPKGIFRVPNPKTNN